MSFTIEIEWKNIFEVRFFFFHFFFYFPSKMTEAITIWQWRNYKQSDMGSHLCCRWLSRVAIHHPPQITHTQTHTHTHIHTTYTHHLNAHFPTFWLRLSAERTDGWIDGPTNRLLNKASYRVACPQLRKEQLFLVSMKTIMRLHVGWVINRSI